MGGGLQKALYKKKTNPWIMITWHQFSTLAHNSKETRKGNISWWVCINKHIRDKIAMNWDAFSYLAFKWRKSIETSQLLYMSHNPIFLVLWLAIVCDQTNPPSIHCNIYILSYCYDIPLTGLMLHHALMFTGLVKRAWRHDMEILSALLVFCERMPSFTS